MDPPCSVYFDLAYFFAAVGCVWVLVLCWGCGAVYCFSRRHTRTLHKVILFVMFFKTLFNLCYAGLLLTCPFTSRSADYTSLAVSSAFTLYYTFLYTVFVLVSKGYCVTRYALDRAEVTVVAVVMGVVYLGFSAYTIEPMLLFPFLLVLILMVLILTVRFSLLTLAVLQRQIDNLVRSGIQDLVQPAIRKRKLMRVFCRCFAGYFSVELCALVVDFGARFGNGPYQLSLWTAILEEAFETPLLLLLFAAFRPKFHGDLSTLPLVDTGNPAEVRAIPPLLTACVPRESVSGLPSLSPNQPLVVLSPVAFQSEDPFLGIEIAQLLTSDQFPQLPILFGR